MQPAVPLRRSAQAQITSSASCTGPAKPMVLSRAAPDLPPVVLRGARSDTAALAHGERLQACRLRTRSHAPFEYIIVLGALLLG